MGEEGSTAPLGVTVKARLNGAKAGKVSMQQGLTEEEVSQLHGRMTLNTTFHNVPKEKKRRRATFQERETEREHGQDMLEEKGDKDGGM